MRILIFFSLLFLGCSHPIKETSVSPSQPASMLSENDVTLQSTGSLVLNGHIYLNDGYVIFRREEIGYRTNSFILNGTGKVDIWYTRNPDKYVIHLPDIEVTHNKELYLDSAPGDILRIVVYGSGQFTYSLSE